MKLYGLKFKPQKRKPYICHLCGVQGDNISTVRYFWKDKQVHPDCFWRKKESGK